MENRMALGVQGEKENGAHFWGQNGRNGRMSLHKTKDITGDKQEDNLWEGATQEWKRGSGTDTGTKVSDKTWSGKKRNRTMKEQALPRPKTLQSQHHFSIEQICVKSRCITYASIPL